MTKKKKHPFGPSAAPTDAGVMPPRKRAVTTEPDVIEESATAPGYESMTRAELYTEAKARDLDVTARSNKDQLIAALTA